ncbi:MAG TPA: HAMP domain-containing sensor histidine kinase, partial [Nitrososphaeraceae archaeon]|nr:HAMP domain-containing sensor histidine kinase [Nitrososphaeraceae archaeon]
RMGILELLRQAAEREEDNKVNVKILTPRNDIIEKKIQEFRTPNIDIASYEEEEELQVEAEKITITTVTIVIVDRKESLVIEKIDDSKQNFIEAVGIATYSNSNPTVLSYISIFRSLWSQIKLYERVKEANIQLKLHDKMQKEFINIASHEIKTPTQAIIGYADLMQRHPGRREEILNAISRNATRLQKLTNDILEVTRIESHTLRLNKEQFDLDDLIQDIVEDYRNQIEKDERKYNIKILYTNQTKNYDKESPFPVMLEADKGRIAQVISNLLNNSLEFTNEGTISINLERIKQEEEQDDHKYDAVISVTDSGQGVDPEILPRLFTKFVTKSRKGTGLGLFISKSIVEAHGGRIWGKNNANGKGATFTFSLPMLIEND